MRLHFQSYGQGEPLLILHGLFGSLQNWHAISLRFAARFQVLAVDQRNHGQSPHSEEMDYPHLAEDLHELVAEQRLERAHVLGHSMGGKAAMQFGLLYPDQVSSLVIADMAPRAYPPHHEGILEALMALRPERFQTRQQMEKAIEPAIPDLALRRFLLKNIMREPGGRWSWRFGLREIEQNYQKLGEEVRGGLPYGGPALFVRGENSSYLTQNDLPEILRLFPRAELRSIPGAGHLVHVQNPDGFFEVISDFLTREQK